jgi:hypothetical protein
MDLIRTFGTPTMPAAGGGSVSNPSFYGRQSPAGFSEAVAGWNFVDGNNNPYDSVHYDHGTGEAEDSTGAANNVSKEVGACPNCMILPIRVGDSFVTSANQFAQAVLFATDSGANVIQEALGTCERPRHPGRRERRRRGSRTPQSPFGALEHDRRQLGDAGYLVQPAEQPLPERVHQLRSEHIGVG